MPVEIGVWRIDQGVEAVHSVPLDFESRLEDMLEQDIAIASPDWMVIGRQVKTSLDKRIDLLAINGNGDLIVLELKRDKTYRDIVAQTLDYGSWIKTLRDDDIARLYSEYRSSKYPAAQDKSLDEAFCERFSVREMPDELNSSHELVIVASSLDSSTERVVNYLSETYGVFINAIFFRVFKDGDREYLTRAWLTEPATELIGRSEPKAGQSEWNGEYYGSFGGGRNWADAVKYGFFSAGGGSWYSKTLQLLSPGDRIWVNIPGAGYVGVGIVTAEVVPLEEFCVTNQAGEPTPIVDMPTSVSRLTKSTDDPETAEFVVAIDWLHTVDVEHAVKEKGFFGNQNSVARPRTDKWDHTVERLKKRFGIAD
jgi:hypothetical protein